MADTADSAAMDEAKLLEKLRLIEALYAGAATSGERGAAAEARERILARLATVKKVEVAIEHVFRIHDPWSRHLFFALARRYEINPYRYRRQRTSTIQVKAPRSFVDGTFWPAFCELDRTLRAYLSDVTSRVIATAVYRDTGDAEVVAGDAPSLPPGQEMLGGGQDGGG